MPSLSIRTTSPIWGLPAVLTPISSPSLTKRDRPETRKCVGAISEIAPLTLASGVLCWSSSSAHSSCRRAFKETVHPNYARRAVYLLGSPSVRIAFERVLSVPSTSEFVLSKAREADISFVNSIIGLAPEPST